MKKAQKTDGQFTPVEVVSLLRKWVVNLLRFRWSIYSGFGWSICPVFPYKTEETRKTQYGDIR
jgi:hypothetical protein